MAITREYYEANKTAILERIRAWQIANPDKRRATCAKYYAQNRDKVKRAQDKYRKDNPAKYLFNLAKRRSARVGVEFNISVEDVVVPKVCPLLGIPINSYSEHPDFRPSLDRIDPKRGYIKGNVQVVSHKANRVKSNANGDELLTMAVNLLRMEGKLP